MNLVVGATGMLGFEICQRLRARGQPTRALVRTGSSKEQLLKDIGAEIVHGDLKDEPTLEAACRGASVVITTANSIVSRRSGDTLETVDRDGSLALIRAAKAAGVGQFIYTSGTPRLPTNNTFVRYKREVESVLRSSGLNWTILQPCALHGNQYRSSGRLGFAQGSGASDRIRSSAAVLHRGRRRGRLCGCGG